MRVLVFSGHENPVLVREMLEAGAHGFVEKTAGLFEFKKVISKTGKPKHSLKMKRK
jgi:DNA-binding NarL/FixJ family response regulator